MIVALPLAQKNELQSDKQTRFLILLSVLRLLTEFAIIILAIAIKNSFPAVHVSIFLSYLVILQILNTIHPLKMLNLLFVIGVISFLLDLTLTSNILQPAFVSSMLTFSIIIGICIWVLYQNEITDIDEKLVGSFLVFYLLILGYYLFMKLLLDKSKVENYASHLFFLSNMIFNIRISYLLWLKKRI